MLNTFDWVRGSRTGAELLAILQMLKDDPQYFDRFTARRGEESLGPPINALATPCTRCWVYPRLNKGAFCVTCRAIREQVRHADKVVRDALVVWGFVNQLPRPLRDQGSQPTAGLLAAHVVDNSHFLLMIRRRELQDWLQELLLYHGAELKGHLQIFPTRGSSDHGIGMGDILCLAIRHEAYFALDKLRVRFYTRSYQVLRPHEADRDGLLTFEAATFLSLLEMATIFRSVLLPAEQQILHQLLMASNEKEMAFYWGRFMGILSQRGKDLLDAWDVRNWSTKRINFLYELTNYVDYQPTT